MIFVKIRRAVSLIIAGLLFCNANGQKLLPFKLSDTGQNGKYTSTKGEDSDYLINPPSFTDNKDGTITDNNTLLIWQKIQPVDSMTWEEALAYSNGFSLAGKSDWRLPNVKELQSLNDLNLINPSFDKNYFPNITSGNYWSSTTLIMTALKAWDINIYSGLVTYHDKTLKEKVLLVRGGMDNKYLNINDVQIPGGEYEMGDHYDSFDPNHPNDELPVHNVKIDTFYIGQNITTNEQYLTFLNSSLLASSIQVTNNKVHLIGDTNTLYYTYQYSPYYSIGYDGNVFSIVDFRANHPVVGVMWKGAAVYCNWLSSQNGIEQCYNLSTWNCYFTKNGYRLPTEAEWEYAGRGGQYNPYYKYPWGNNPDDTKANWPNSGDPYETGAYPLTTPVGFYDGTLKKKSDYNWPGSATTYQTTNGANGFGLYDMAGNTWEFINDWYLTNYYNISPYDNPKGPDSGSIMPDGKQYKGMRGGNWYNGDIVDSVNDGHSRVSNRDPSYYRGPLDPNNPWYHVSFRVARNNSLITGINYHNDTLPKTNQLIHNYPNPFHQFTTIKYFVPSESHVILRICNIYGQEIASLVDHETDSGWHVVVWDGTLAESGVYNCTLSTGANQSAIKMVLIK